MEGQDKGNLKTFIHSVKVPRLYKEAAKVAKEASEGLGSLKNLVYDKKHPNVKAAYALVATLYKRRNEIDNLLKRSQFLTKEPRADPWLAKVLLVELLWGKGRLPGQSRPENTVRAYEQIFRAHLSDVKSVDDQSNETKVDTKPRYVRVNTLKITLNDAIEKFRDDGWTFVKFLEKDNYTDFINRITTLEENEFMVDIHIPNLLIFPPGTTFYNHPAYKNGSIILQDKASCLPVHILGPPPGSVVLDMCAAPGMKTTHLAAVMNSEGTIFAVERHPKRFETLNRILEGSGATCVQTINKDVLTCSANDFPNVEYILVDPSCTGSGMTDYIAAKQGEESRNFNKLTGFQIMILRSALTRYPQAKRVIYSTCSLYPEENEDVVRQVLETNYKFKLVDAGQFVNNAWKNFGSPDFGDIGKFCLYAKPNDDFTNGFFIAVFERLEEGEENKFFNNRIFNYKKDVAIKEKRKKKREEKEKTLDEEFSGNNENKLNLDMECNNTGQVDNHEENTTYDHPRKKKKKVHNSDSHTETPVDVAEKSNLYESSLSNGLLTSDSLKNKKKDDTKNAFNIDGESASVDENIQNDAQETKKKKKKKNKTDNGTETCISSTEKVNGEIHGVVSQTTREKKKKTKKHKSLEDDTQLKNDSPDHEIVTAKVKKTKNYKSENVTEVLVNGTSNDLLEISEEAPKSTKKKSKKKRKNRNSSESETKDESSENKDAVLLEVAKKKKEKKSALEVEDISELHDGTAGEYGIRIKKCKKKKREKADSVEPSDYTNDGAIDGVTVEGNVDSFIKTKKKDKLADSKCTDNFMEELNSFSIDNIAALEGKKKKKRKLQSGYEDAEPNSNIDKKGKKSKIYH